MSGQRYCIVFDTDRISHSRFGKAEKRGRKEALASVKNEFKNDPKFSICTYEVDGVKSTHDTRMEAINEIADAGIRLRKETNLSEKTRIAEAYVFINEDAHREYLRWVVSDVQDNVYTDLLKVKVGIEKVLFVKTTDAMFDTMLVLEHTKIKERAPLTSTDDLSRLDLAFSKLSHSEIANIVSSISGNRPVSLSNLLIYPSEIRVIKKEKPFYSHKSVKAGIIALRLPYRVIEQVVEPMSEIAKCHEFLEAFKASIRALRERYVASDKRLGLEVFCPEQYREFLNRKPFEIENDLCLYSRGIKFLDREDAHPCYILHSMDVAGVPIKVAAYYV